MTNSCANYIWESITPSQSNISPMCSPHVISTWDFWNIMTSPETFEIGWLKTMCIGPCYHERTNQLWINQTIRIFGSDKESLISIKHELYSLVILIILFASILTSLDDFDIWFWHRNGLRYCTDYAVTALTLLGSLYGSEELST